MAHAFLPGRIEGRQAALASWFLRQNQGFQIDSKSLGLVEQVRPLDVASRGAGLLSALGRMFPNPGDQIPPETFKVNPVFAKLRTVERDNIYAGGNLKAELLEPLKLLALSASQNDRELTWLVANYLLELGYLRIRADNGAYEITISGWQAITAAIDNTQSKMGFIAMSFASEFLPLYEEALHPGIFNAGYQPVRIDRVEHNNRIDDEIIANIRKSRFVVTDLSKNRGGIYFEAGYALGLGLPVIWTVEHTALGEVHFDNRQYNFLTWERGKYDDLARRITNRIEATIGRPS